MCVCVKWNNTFYLVLSLSKSYTSRHWIILRIKFRVTTSNAQNLVRKGKGGRGLGAQSPLGLAFLSPSLNASWVQRSLSLSAETRWQVWPSTFRWRDVGDSGDSGKLKHTLPLVAAPRSSLVCREGCYFFFFPSLLFTRSQIPLEKRLISWFLKADDIFLNVYKRWTRQRKYISWPHVACTLPGCDFCGRHSPRVWGSQEIM